MEQGREPDPDDHGASTMALDLNWEGLPNALRLLAVEEATSQIGQVTGSSEYGYDVELSDGATLSAVPSATRGDWPDETWVLLEKASGTWQIVGLAPHRAGPSS